MRTRRSFSRKFAFETLETRAVLNGTVIASNAAGALTLTGDGGNNIIALHQVGTNADGGAIIQVVSGGGTKINNADTAQTGFSFTFGRDVGVTSIDIEMAGGRDVVTFYNTTVTSSITVNMDDPSSGGVGDGNDVLSMVNVHSSQDVMNVSLGNGTNVASLFRVSSGSDFTLMGGNNRDIVALNTVASNTSPAASNDTFTVDLEGGNLDTLAVINCTDGPGGSGFFSDSGTNAIITGLINHFDHHTTTGFRYRFGDLKNDVA